MGLQRLLVAWNFARITGFVPVSYAFENYAKWAAKEGDAKHIRVCQSHIIPPAPRPSR